MNPELITLVLPRRNCPVRYKCLYVKGGIGIMLIRVSYASVRHCKCN